MQPSSKREISGQWWLPSTPDDKWVGTLTLEPDKSPRLAVTIPKGYHFFEGDPPPVIHGHDHHGHPVTLLWPAWPRSTAGMALTQSTFPAGYAVLGLSLADPADFRLNTLTLQLQHLYDWLGITGFLRQPWDGGIDFRIDYRRPEDQSFSITSDLTLEIHSTSRLSRDLKEHAIREDVCVSFRSTAGLDLKACKELMTALRHLLHFASLSPVFMLSITGTKAGHGATIDDNFYPQEIELYNSIIRGWVESDPRWIFRFANLRPRFPQFFSDWLNFLRTYDEAFDCYMTTVYHPLPSEVKLLCLTQALEAFHGIKFQSHQTQYFATKIQDLAAASLPHLQALIPNPAEFAEVVRDNRNYYTHHNPKSLKDGGIVKGAPLIRLNEKLTLIFQLSVLCEMAIPADHFQELRRQLASGIIDYE